MKDLTTRRLSLSKLPSQKGTEVQRDPGEAAPMHLLKGDLKPAEGQGSCENADSVKIWKLATRAVESLIDGTDERWVC